MSDAWEEYERFYDEKFEKQLVEQELDQAMPFNRFVFYIATAGIVVGLLCAFLVRHYR